MTPSMSAAHCRVTSRLGEDEMGVVYRAHDTKLGRDPTSGPSCFGGARVSIQVQRDRASFVARRGGEPQSQYSSRRGEDRQLYTRTDESNKLTGLRRRRPIPM